MVTTHFMVMYLFPSGTPDQVDFGVTFSDSFQNQMKEPVFAVFRCFAKLYEDLAQKSIGADRVHRKVVDDLL